MANEKNPIVPELTPTALTALPQCGVQPIWYSPECKRVDPWTRPADYRPPVGVAAATPHATPRRRSPRETSNEPTKEVSRRRRRSAPSGQRRSEPPEVHGPVYSQRQLTLPLWDEIFIDNFAGGGGASKGIEMALNRPVDMALNHNWVALAMHRMNHPQTLHFREDIRRVDWLKKIGARRVGGVWWSPDCTHHSRARAGKPKKKEIRGLAWTIVHFVNLMRKRPVGGNARVMYLENVLEFLSWNPVLPDGTVSTWRPSWFFVCLTGALFRRGFRDIEWTGPDGYIWRRTWSGLERTELQWSNRASDHGMPTIRQRLYGIMRSDGRPIIWPKETHAPRLSEAVRAGAKLPHESTANYLDMSLPCPSIFFSREEAKAYRCKRPLAPASEARIAKGVDRHVIKAAEPFLFDLTHQGNDGVASIRTPIRTITGANRGEKAFVSATLAQAQNPGEITAFHITKFHGDSAGVSVMVPAPTITANSYVKRPGCAVPLGVVATKLVPLPAEPSSAVSSAQTVAAHVLKMRGAPETHPAGHSPAAPLGTISAQGNHHGVVAVFLAQQNGGVVGHQSYGHPPTDPLSTISAKGCQQQVVFTSLVQYNGTDQNPQIGEPSHTVTSTDRFGLLQTQAVIPPLTPELRIKALRVAQFLRDYGVEVEGKYARVGPYIIVDIGMRMLTPRELYLLQGFPPTYIIDRGLHIDEDGRLLEIELTRTEQIHMCGNSVCPGMARTLVAANNPEMRENHALAA